MSIELNREPPSTLSTVVATIILLLGCVLAALAALSGIRSFLESRKSEPTRQTWAEQNAQYKRPDGTYVVPLDAELGIYEIRKCDYCNSQYVTVHPK